MHLNSLVVADSLFLSQVIRRVSWKGPDADLNKCPFKLGSWLRSQYFYSINVQAQPTATLPLLTQAKTLNNSKTPVFRKKDVVRQKFSLHDNKLGDTCLRASLCTTPPQRRITLPCLSLSLCFPLSLSKDTNNNSI